MWYVIQTLKGREEKDAEEIQRDVVYDENLFILQIEMEYKIKREWIIDRKPFFPGYIFVEMEPEKAEAFDKRLRKAKHKLLEVDGRIQPIKPHEEEYLLMLGGEEHIIRHSQGFRVDDMVRITSGSFRGYDGEIRKLDRHNRRASIVIPFMGRDVEVKIGLEIVENLTQDDISAEELLKLGKSSTARLATV